MKPLAASALAVALISALLLGLELRAVPLFNCDEALYAAVARNMAADGGYFRMTLNGQPYYDKPPLVFWLTAAVGKLTGDPEFAIRRVMVAAGAAVAGLTFLLAALTAESRWAGLGAVAALFALKDFSVFARIGMMDMPLTALVSAAAVGLLLIDRPAVPRAVPAILIAASIAGAVLTKYVVGLLPLALAAPWWMTDPSPRRRLVLAAVSGVALPALFFGWQLAVYGRPYWNGFILYHAVRNVLVQQGGESLPWWFYLQYLTGPRCSIMLAAALAGLIAFRAPGRFRRLLLIWLLLPLAIFTVRATRFPWYLVVMMPALAVAGGWFVAALARHWRPLAGAMVALWCILGAANLIERYTYRAPLSVAMKDLCAVVVRGWQLGDRIVLYRQMAINADQAYYYLDRRVVELADNLVPGNRSWVFVYQGDEPSITFPPQVVAATSRENYTLYLIR